MYNTEDKYKKLLKPGPSPELALVRAGWNDCYAAIRYHLVTWNALSKTWQCKAEGDKAWMERVAKHYNLETPPKKQQLVQG